MAPKTIVILAICFVLLSCLGMALECTRLGDDDDSGSPWEDDDFMDDDSDDDSGDDDSGDDDLDDDDDSDDDDDDNDDDDDDDDREASRGDPISCSSQPQSSRHKGEEKEREEDTLRTA